MRESLIIWGPFLVLLSSDGKFGNALMVLFESSGNLELMKIQMFNGTQVELNKVVHDEH